MPTAITTGGKFYTPKYERHNSTRTSTVSRESETSSTNKLRSKYYTDILENQKLLSNIKKVKGFLDLAQNWNDNNASPFKPILVSSVLDLLLSIYKQPETFPTSRGSIQFEYEKENGDYLEFEIFEDKIQMFYMDEYEREKEEEIAIHNTQKINKIVRDFYERNV